MPKTPPDTQALLDSAAKKEPRKADPFICDDKPTLALARTWLGSALAMEAEQEKLKTFREKIVERLTPWHLAQCRERDAHEPSVLLETSKGSLRVSFPHRYTKIGAKQEAKIQELAGEDFKRWFRKGCIIGIKKEITEDQAALEELVQTLAKVLGPEQFAAIFEVKQPLTPTEEFTAERFDLADGELEALEAAGVKQIVGLARAK